MSTNDNIKTGILNTGGATTTIMGEEEDAAAFNGNVVLWVHVAGNLTRSRNINAIQGDGIAGGVGVKALGGGGGINFDGNAGVLAIGGKSALSNSHLDDRSPNGAGVLAIAGSSTTEDAQGTSPPNDAFLTQNVGVFAQGSDQVEELKAVVGHTPFTVGPDYAGAGVIGRGGGHQSNGEIANGPLGTAEGGGAGLVGIAGGTNTPTPSDYSNAGVFGISDQPDGRGGVFKSTNAQLNLVPIPKVPNEETAAPNVVGRPGDLLVTTFERHGFGHPRFVRVAQLYFCTQVDRGVATWQKLA